MKRIRTLSGTLVVALLLAMVAGVGQAQDSGTSAPAGIEAAMGTAFTYQGRLKDGGSPANGTYDFAARLYDAVTGGTQIGSQQTVDDKILTDGLFTLELDFGTDCFNGEARWLEIDVKKNSSSSYTTLIPRVRLTPAPGALALPGLWTQQNSTSPNLIGGYSGNSVTAGVWGATIGGGGQSGSVNLVTGYYGTVGGGHSNTAYQIATVGGGYGNTASGGLATIGGGDGNIASGAHATVGGGNDNTASGIDATVGGGSGNTADIDWATVAGGSTNQATGPNAFVGGGGDNVASGSYATIPGGTSNTAVGNYSFAAGVQAKANHPGTFVWADSTGGDLASTANDQFLVRASGGVILNVAGGALRLEPNATSPNLVGGFRGNSVTGGVYGATIGGGGRSGSVNLVTSYYGTVGGGHSNTASGQNATVGGGGGNTADSEYATVGGGNGNIASGYAATIPGGDGNAAVGSYSFAAGHRAKANHPGAFVWADSTAADLASTANDQFLVRASGGVILNTTGGGVILNTTGGALRLEPHATSPNLVGGYSGNSVTAGVYGATIGGGGESGAVNRVTDNYGTVGGGFSNQAGNNDGMTGNARYATVGGGGSNTASGYAATVGGGSSNGAHNDYATVGGGSGNAASGIAATIGGGQSNTATNNYATIGGGSSNTATGTAATVPGGHSNRAQGHYSFAAGRRAQANSMGCFVWGDSTDANITCEVEDRTIFRSTGGFYIYTNASLTSGVYLSAGGSGWLEVSDRARKENFRPVDTLALLDNLAAIEISTWNYRAQDPAIRHVGPMAQDFNALLLDLGGEGEAYINTLDADGVALAAIQGLYQLVQEQEAQISDLEARLSALEQQLAGQPAPPLPRTGLPATWLLVGALVLAGATAGRLAGGRKR